MKNSFSNDKLRKMIYAASLAPPQNCDDRRSSPGSRALQRESAGISVVIEDAQRTLVQVCDVLFFPGQRRMYELLPAGHLKCCGVHIRSNDANSSDV